TLFDRELDPANARAAKLRLAECFVFSWVVGHNDGHTKNYSLSHLPGATILSPFYDLNSSLPFELPSTVRASDYRAFDGVKLAFSIDGSATIGSIGPASIRVLERDAQLPEGHLAEFTLTVAASLQPVVADVIGHLPDQLQQIEAVKLYPFATYAQTLRVRDLFLP
ncbi:HipA domain-containing protein, partial [Salinibacterium sp.]|uniref:HipA domain-containing protein n=1 Tax=Salinibacterium sp. TaxID=1915057 RepID=UPI00286B8C9D